MNNVWMLELQELSPQDKLIVEHLRGQHSLHVINQEDSCRVVGSKELLKSLIIQLNKEVAGADFHAVNATLPLSTQKKTRQQQSFYLIAGPCSVESYKQIEICMNALKQQGITWMRAGIFKPRSSPYTFQGHGFTAIEWMKELKPRYNLRLVSEILDPRDIDQALDVVDMIQIGTRNMHNTSLLKAIAPVGKPVLLKRGWSSTYHEWLSSAEYLLYHGAKEVLLCERGIRSFENHTRFTLDINAIAVMKGLTHLPILIDPSHGTGKRQWVMPAARAAVAAGADGLLVEVHPDPDHALSDAEQSLPLESLKELTGLLELREWMKLQGMLG